MTDTYYQLFDRDLDFEHGTGIIHTVNQATGALENLGRGGHNPHEGPGTAGPSADQQAEISHAESAYKPFRFPPSFRNYGDWRCNHDRVIRQYHQLLKGGVDLPGPGPYDYDDPLSFNLPDRPHSQAYWVRQLFEAIVSIRDHKDARKGGSVAEPAQAVVMIIQQREYTVEDIEYACWDVFYHCQLRQMGIDLVEEYQGGRAEYHDSFEDRMHAIVNACREYKTVCKLLLDVPYIRRFAHAPNYEANRTGQTSKLTENLDRLIAAAADATKSTHAGPTVSGASTIDTRKEAFTASKAPSLPNETLFKRRICHILSVTEDFAHIFSLDQLRTYAFAYNRDLPDRHWTVEASATEYGDGITWLRQADNSIHSVHFALTLREYWDLAVARNDLTPNGEVTDVHRTGFTVQGVVAYHQALGMVENSCGLFQPLK